MITIDEILTDLKGSQFEQVLLKSVALARDQHSEFWQNKKAGRFAEPGYYPAARLLQAYALAGNGMCEQAQAVITEEVERLRQGTHARIDFILSHHIALAAVMASQKGVIADGLLRYEVLVNKVAAMTAKRKGGEELVYRVSLRDLMAFELDLRNVHQLVQTPVDVLIGKLNEKSYYLLTPVAKSDYNMPEKMTRQNMPVHRDNVGVSV
ncbi:hypothetical protein HYY73_04020 [Candidatus Woesearchaeota archaeon]|nr:hypothetical protein [Candidatus Woesearchaeota archaeon]